MAEQGIYKLKIDDEFKRLIPSLTKVEMQRLEQNILRDGCREPICIWNNMIVDGHNRYEICTRNQIPFSIQHIFFKNRLEVIAWICTNQLGRRNISEETRKYLIGKRYEMEKILGAHNAAGVNQHSKKEVGAKMLPEPQYEDKVVRTRERLGEEYNISHASVLNYGRYSNALDSLSRTVPELVPKILSGEVKISRGNVIRMSQLPSQDVRRLERQISYEASGFSDVRKLLPIEQENIMKKPLYPPAGSVKDMPAYDPDADISSLVLTIPSWVRSIDRARTAADLNGISIDARRKLKQELLGLKDTVESILATMKEEV